MIASFICSLDAEYEILIHSGYPKASPGTVAT